MNTKIKYTIIAISFILLISASVWAGLDHIETKKQNIDLKKALLATQAPHNKLTEYEKEREYLRMQCESVPVVEMQIRCQREALYRPELNCEEEGDYNSFSSPL